MPGLKWPYQPKPRQVESIADDQVKIWSFKQASSTVSQCPSRLTGLRSPSGGSAEGGMVSRGCVGGGAARGTSVGSVGITFFLSWPWAARRPELAIERPPESDLWSKGASVAVSSNLPGAATWIGICRSVCPAR